MADIVILGAGLTGLSTAYHLEKQGYYSYKLFEKDALVGGLCRSVTQDGFTFDYTGHLLHVNDEYFRTFVEGTIGFQNLTYINRRSFIYSQDTYTRYPYQINLYGLPTETIAECIEGFIKRPHSARQAKTFHRWVLQNFGAGFGKNFFFPYQEKIFSYDVKKLSASWTGRFVPNTTLHEMIQGAISEREETIGYNAQFFYPIAGGINAWIQSIAKLLTNPIYTNHLVERIDIANKKIYFKNGESESYKVLISTLPLNLFLKSCKESSRTTLNRAVAKLQCNSVINFNLGINRPMLSDKHWIYYPEKKYPFYRLGFPHNFSHHMAPEGCSSLYGEFSHINASPEKQAELLNDALHYTKQLLHISQQDILTEVVIPISHAYVIFNTWRDTHLPTLLNTLKEESVYSVGRYGAWKYSSMQEGVLDGKSVAEETVRRLR